MTDTTFNIATANADGGSVSLTVGAPVNQVYTGTVANNQSTIVVPDTALTPSISSDVQVNAQVTVGTLTAQSQVTIRNSVAPASSGVATIAQAGATFTSGTIDITLAWPAGTSATRRADVYMDIGDGQGFQDLGASMGYPSTTGPSNVSVPQDGRTISFRIYSWDTANGTLLLDGNNRPDTSVDGVDEVTVTATANTFVSSGNNYGLFAGDIPAERAQLYTKPAVGSLLNEPGKMSFTSWSALINQLNSQNDHGGQIYVYDGQESTNGYNPQVQNASNYKVAFSPTAELDGGSTDLVSNGAYYGLRLENSSNIEWHDTRFKNLRNGAISLGDESAPNGTTGSSGIKIIGGSIVNCGQWGIKMTQQSSDITVEGYYGENIGRQTDASGEFLYVGDGNDGNLQYATDVIIKGCSCKTVYGEAVDVKRDSSNVYIGYCDFDEIILQHSGAITIALNDIASRGAYNINVVLEHNYIKNVRNRDTGFSIHGILVGMGYVRNYRNILTDIHGVGIAGINDFNGPNSNVDNIENIILRCGGATIQQDTGNNVGDNNVGVFHNDRNIVDDGIANQGTNGSINNENLIGPLTQYSGFSPA